MECVYYERNLGKKVPCILIPGELHSKTNDLVRKTYVHIYFDSTRFVEFGVTEGELNRYCSEFININELYPTNTQAQKDYANAVIPNGFTNNSDELDRYEAIINMITDVSGDISKNMFYLLSDLVSYELLFTKCTYDERIFMMGLSSSQLNVQPDPIKVPQMIRMTKRLFEKYTDTVDTNYDIDNYNYYYIHDGALPIVLNIDNLKYNVNFIII